MELLFHIGMIFTIMAVSLTGMGRSSSYILEFDGDQSEFVDALDHIEPVKGEEEQPDRFLVDPLNFDALHFGPIRPRGPKGGSKFPWSPRSQFKMPQQSPIDICTCNCKPIAYNSPPLTLTYAKTERKEGIMIEMSNSGHGVTLKVPRFEARPTLSGGMLPNTYHFDNLHCHWGKDDAMGSEHYINGEAYAMECHLVTYNSKYQDINDALNNCVQKDQDSVCVYTTMFKLATEDNRKLKPMLDNIPRIRQNGSSILVANQEILSFIWEQASLPNKKEYIAYPGSLTTPPHTPCVNFLIEQTPTHISSKQLSVLRTMMDNHTPSKPVLTNRREIQTLNRRPIYCVKPPIKTSVKQIGPETSNDVDYNYYWDRGYPYYPVIRYGK